MLKLSRLKNESLINFANRVADHYNCKNTRSKKKGKGQFFTPPSVAKFMANLETTAKNSVSILDPGAGLGILSVSLLQKFANQGKVKEVNLVCYETDKHVLPYLEATLRETKRILSKKLTLNYSLLEKDFISTNAHTLTRNYPQEQLFDIIISNPPYFKINKKDIPAVKFRAIISGQPNIYYIFMAISAKLLSDDGEMIFITPRSFCSGLYYHKFRKWLIENVNFSNIHIFDSRKELFSKENVLQENIITKFTKDDVKTITISKSYNGDFSQLEKINVLEQDVIYKSNGHTFFRIPSNQSELVSIRTLDKLPHDFFSLGLKISTGRVVAFRNKKYLQQEASKDSIPLIWMHNIRNGGIQWPFSHKDKASAIKKTPASEWLFHQPGNYLVMKRFTPKELKKRFVTACIFEEDFEENGAFALDNMINYVYKPNGKLSKNQVKGIAKYLDLPIVDIYFRVLNGHTQVNANEVYSLPFPSLEKLEALGRGQDSNVGILQESSPAILKKITKRLLYA